MKKNKIIPDSLILPNKNFISKEGVEYVRHVAALSKQVYDNTNNFTVQYGKDIRESIDIFVPDYIARKIPVLIFIHGGYWINGSKEMVGYLAKDILKLPMIFVSVGYKLAPEHKFPIALNDCKHGIEKAYEVLEQYGGDKNKIVIAGHSAGGNLAMLLLVKNYLDIPLDSIKLCSTVSGVFDINNCPSEVKNNFVGSEADYVNGSPICYDFSKITTPMLLISGTEDFQNVKQDNESMSAKLKYHGCDFYEMIEDGENHFGLTLQITNNHRWIEFVKNKAYAN